MMSDRADEVPIRVSKIDRLTYTSDMLSALMVLFEEGSLLWLLISAAKAEADLSVIRAHAGTSGSSEPLRH